MNDIPHLLFRKLESSELEVAAAAAAACAAADDPANESFGLTPDGPPAEGGEIWGVFEKGTLSAVGWILPDGSGSADVTGAALPRRRWGTGLLGWMLQEWAREYAPGAGGEVRAEILSGGPALGEALTDAGMSGPDPEDEGYPAGGWRLPGSVG